MNYEHFTSAGQQIGVGDIVRAPFHGSAWPAKIERLGRHRVTVRPMTRDGTAWDFEKIIHADDIFFHISASEARALELPQVAA